MKQSVRHQSATSTECVLHLSGVNTTKYFEINHKNDSRGQQGQTDLFEFVHQGQEVGLEQLRFGLADDWLREN